MPRTYIVRDADEKKNIVGKTWNEAYNGAVIGEGYVLGNTDFDAIYNPITAFNFVLEVEGIYFLPIKTVRAFTKENEFEYIREGGVNDYVHLKRKPISKPFTFQIERYVGTERFLDPLANGTELVLPLILYVYRHAARSGVTVSAPAWPARVYTFTGCTVMSKEYGALDAEKAGLVTETTTIAYRELVVLTNPFQSSSEGAEWNFKDNIDKDGPGYVTKYAAFSPNDDKSKDVYPYEWVTEEGKSRMRAKTDGTNTFAKEKWDGRENAQTWAEKAKPDIADATYKKETVDGVTTITRKDSNTDYNRPQYQMSKDMNKSKYATESAIDKEGGERVYETSKSKDGLDHTKRIDHAQVNKGAWDGAKGTKVSWAKQSNPDMADSTYTVTVKDGVQTVKRKDDSQYNQAYDFAKDKTKLKRAAEATVDKNAAAPIYGTQGGHIVRKDGAEMQKEPYSYKKDGENVKWAAESPIDHETPEVKEPYEFGEENTEVKWAAESPIDHEKPEVKEPYQYGTDNVANKWAETSKKDKEEPEVKEPYQYGEKNVANKWAKTSPKDKEKPEAKEPYKYDDLDNKWATPSPKDKPLQTPVTWPPTRRALMAESLKK